MPDFVGEASVPALQICFYDNNRHQAEVVLEWAPRRYHVQEDQVVLAEAAERYRRANERTASIP